MPTITIELCRDERLEYASCGMDRTYDIFEKYADGSLMWVDSVPGHENAIRKLREYAETTTNECCLMHLPTQAVIATMNASKSDSASA